MNRLILSVTKIVLALGAFGAIQQANAATCEFKVPVKNGVFDHEFTVVGKGTTVEKALADAAMKCFAHYEKDHGGKAAADDQSLDAIDICANPPGC